MALAQDKAPVSWWYEDASPDNQDNLKTIVERPSTPPSDGTQLTIDFRGAELDKQLRVAMLSGSGPDIVYTPGPATSPAMAQAGQLLPLDDYAAKLGWNDRILPVFLELGKYDGKLYALPKTYETLGLFYNKTLFDTNGWSAPTTIAELETLADADEGQGDRPVRGRQRRLAADQRALRLDRPQLGRWPRQRLQGAERRNSLDVRAVRQGHRYAQQVVAERAISGPTISRSPASRPSRRWPPGQAGMAPTGTWNFQNVATYFPQNNAEPGFVGFPER